MRSARDSSPEQRFPGWFWGLWSAQLINRVASFAQPFLILFLTTDHGLSVSMAGTIASGVGVGSVVATLAGGWSADLLGRRGTMLVSQATTAGALVWLATADGLWQLWSAAMAVGVGSNLIRPAINATVGDAVAPHLLVRAFGMLIWAVNLGFSMATLTAGFLVRWGYPTMFLVNAAASVVAGLIILRWVPETRPTSARVHTALLGSLVGDRGIIVLLVVGFAYALMGIQAFSTLPVVMSADGIDASGYGFLLAINGVVICVLQPFVPRLVEHLRGEHVYAVGLLLLGGGFTLTCLAHSPVQHALVVVVWTLGEIASTSVVSALVTARAPAPLLARYHGLSAATLAAGTAFGPLLGAWMLDNHGSVALWLGCGVTGVISAALMLTVPPAPHPEPS